MKRRLIQLTPSQEARLAELVAADGNSLAAHIRTAVDLYLRIRAKDVDAFQRHKPGRKKVGAGVKSCGD